MIDASRAGWRNLVPIAVLLVFFTLGTAGCSTTNNNGNCDAQGGNNGVTCIAPTKTVVNSSSAASSPPSSPPTSSTSPPAPHKSYYLIDLNVISPGAFGGSFNTGVASLGGQQYSKSFYEDTCVATPIIVGIPANMTRVSGVVGYTDDSPYRLGDANGNPFQVEIDESADPPGSNAEWRRIWLGTLPTHGVTSFSVPLDQGMDALKLVPLVYSCSTDIGWGNPTVH